MDSIVMPVANDGNVVHMPPMEPTLHKKHGSHATNGNITRTAVLHRSLKVEPLRVVSAQGNRLHLCNGQSIFDATGGAAVACLGHGNDRVTQAILEQSKHAVAYCHSLFYATDATEDLARLLVDTTDGEMTHAFFVSSGSEAIEAAIKMARQYHLDKPQPEPERTRFIARQQSYHGTTLGALGVGGHKARRSIYEPMLAQNASFVSPCYAYRGLHSSLEHDGSYVRRLESELDAEFQRIGPGKVAAFIAEPIVGAALGCVASVPGYFKAMRRVCDKYGVLLILDEVMCGAGRAGPQPSARFPKPLHAWQDPSVGIVPDIMTMGKALGGGFIPIAGMMVSGKVVEVLTHGTGAFSHGQTYQGHPMACRAALEVQRIIQEENLVDNVRVQGALLVKLLKQKLASHPHVGNIRGAGLFWGIELVRDKCTKQPFAPSDAVASGIHELGMQEPFNISLYPGSGTVDGISGDHILLAPAYNTTSADIQTVADTTAAVIQAFFYQRGMGDPDVSAWHNRSTVT